MGDNTTLNIGIGGDVIATEDPGLGYKIPVSKIRLGATDIDGGDVTITNPFPILITDGANGQVAVKSASTAAIAIDKALVVSLSPNSPIPTGSNTIGTVTANAGTGSFTVVQATGSNLNAVISGIVTANIGTSGSLALDATLTGGTQQSKITDGTNVAAVKAASTAAGTTDKALVVAISPNNTVPISVASLPLPSGAATATLQGAGLPLALGSGGGIKIDGSGFTLPVKIISSTATQSAVVSSATNVTLLAANTARVSGTVFNHSSAILYLILGAIATASAFTVQINPNGYYEIPGGYTGIIAGIWSSANGSALMTELT